MRCSFKLKVLLGIFVKGLLGFRDLNHNIYRPCLGPAMLTLIKAPNQARPTYRSARIVGMARVARSVTAALLAWRLETSLLRGGSAYQNNLSRLSSFHFLVHHIIFVFVFEFKFLS